MSPDAHQAAIRSYVTRRSPTLSVSHFGMVEFASGIAGKVRQGQLTEESAKAILLTFDRWAVRTPIILAVEAADYALAGSYVRDFPSGLKAPDALHLAIASRLGSAIFTFDKPQARAALRYRIEVITPEN